MTLVIAVSVTALSFPQMDMGDLPSGQDGAGLGRDGMSGFGMQMLNPGTYGNHEACYSIRVFEGFTGMSLPSAVNSIWVVEDEGMEPSRGGVPSSSLSFCIRRTERCSRSNR